MAMADESLLEYLSEQLVKLKKTTLYRKIKLIEGPCGSNLIINGKKYLAFCSNDYLGLANHPKLKQAAKAAISQYGSGSGASRLICGTQSLHIQLEQKLAKFKQAPAAIVFPSGYMANLGIISSVVGRGDIIIIDRLSHASIIDACRLSYAKLAVYPHNDLNKLEHILKRSQNYNQRLIITDSIFSMDGDLADLPALAGLARRYNAALMIDEAHATGVLGESGRGAAEHFGLKDEIDISMGTLSKAAGSMGGFVTGDKQLIDFLRQRARSFIYTTALPAAACAASIAGLDIIINQPQLRKKLWQNTKYLKNGLKKLGFKLMGTQSPIIPILLYDEDTTMRAAEYLFEHGILIPGIRPPTVPKGKCRLRISLSATHSKDELDYLLSIIKSV